MRVNQPSFFMSPTFLSRPVRLPAIIAFTCLSSLSLPQCIHSSLNENELTASMKSIAQDTYHNTQKTFNKQPFDYSQQSDEPMQKNLSLQRVYELKKQNKQKEALTLSTQIADRYAPSWKKKPKCVNSTDQELGELFFTMSTLAHQLGNHARAKHCGGLAITIYGNTNQKAKKASVQNLIATIYKEQAELESDKLKQHTLRVESMKLITFTCRNYRRVNAKENVQLQQRYDNAFKALKSLAKKLKQESPADLCWFAKAYFELGQSALYRSNNQEESDLFFQKAYNCYWILLSNGRLRSDDLNSACLVFLQLPKDSKPSYNLFKHGSFLGERLLKTKQLTEAMQVYEITLNAFWNAHALPTDKDFTPSFIQMHEKLVGLCMQHHEYSTAADCYGHMISFYQKRNQPTEMYQSRAARDYASALSAHCTKNFAAAEKLFLQATNSFKELGDHKNTTKCLLLCNLACRAQGNFLEAARTIFNLANFLYEEKKYSRAKEQLINAKNAVHKLPPPSPKVEELLNACSDLSAKIEKELNLAREKQANDNFEKGKQYAEKKAYEKALSCYTLAHKAYVDLKNDSRIDECLYQTGNIYAAQKNHKETIDTYTALKDHRIKVYQTTIHPKVAEAIHAIAGCYEPNTKEDIDTRTKLLEETLAIQRKCLTQDTSDDTQEIALAGILNDLGACYHMTSNTLHAASDSPIDTSQQPDQAATYLQQSMECHKEAFSIREKVTPNSTSLAVSHSNLASCFWQKRNAYPAVTHYLSGIKICENSKETKLDDYLYMRKNLIYIYEATGQLDNALAQVRKTWQFIKNPTIDNIWLCHAYIRLYTRQLQAIQPNNNAGQPVQQLTPKKNPQPNNLKKKHASTKYSKTSTQQFYTRQIINWHKEILTINEKAKNQAGIIEASHLLGNFLYRNRKFQKALPYFQKAYQLAKKFSSTEDIPTRITNTLKADIGYSLGNTLYTLEKFKESIDPLLYASHLYEKEPAREELTINCHIALGHDYVHTKNIPASITYYEKALKGHRNTPIKGRLYELKLASIYHDTGFACGCLDKQKQRSLAYYNKALVLQEKHFDISELKEKNELKEYFKDSENIKGQTKLASIYKNIGAHFLKTEQQTNSNTDKAPDYKSAQKWYGKAFKVHDSIFKSTGKHKKELLNVYLHIAKIEKELKNYEGAIKIYKPALRLAKLIHGNQHPEVGKILNRLGLNLYYANENEESFKCNQDANKIFSESSSTYFLERANTLHILGLTCDRLGDPSCIDEKISFQSANLLMLCSKEYFNKATKYLEESVKIRRQHLPKKNTLIGIALAALGFSYARTKQIEKCVKAYLEAIDIAQHNKDPVALKQYISEIKEVCQEGIAYYTKLQKRELKGSKKAHKRSKKESKYTHYLTRLNKYKTKANEDTPLSETTTSVQPPLPPITAPLHSIATGSNLQS